jgi:carboxyl-terminal processing protease
MSGRTRLLVLAVSTPLVAFVLVGGLLGASRTAEQQGLEPLKVFLDVQQLIRSAYVEPVNIDKVMDGAMRGLADGLDPTSSFLAPDEVRAVETRAPLAPADVGLYVVRQVYLRVVGVRDGSPAQRAGLQSGDYLRAINDTPSRDLSAFEGNRLLRGAAGSKVRLLVIRGNVADPHTIELTREAPPADRAAGKRLVGGEAYVRISSFESGAATALRAALTTLGPAADPGIIIDLRDTADGSLEEGIAAARLFVKNGVLATLAGRGPEKSVTTAAASDGAFTMRVVLLVSNGTANAAEVFASALADNGRAMLVGEPTAGLAGVQSLVKLPEGYGLWMTTKRYLQKDGNAILGRGLRPDVAVEIPSIAFDEAPPATDVPLQRAVETLHQPVPVPAAPAATGVTPSTDAPRDPARNLPPTNAPGTPPPAPAPAR